MAAAPLPRTVAIVGRPNVGKSALFNRITGKQIALVFDRPGTTRDRLVATVRRRGHAFSLVDTGGIGLDDKEGFSEAIAREANLALETATDILLVVDARAGLTPLDRELAAQLRRAKSRAPVLVVANKVDDEEKLAHWEAEFAELGLGEPIAVSAAHGRGIETLLGRLMASWPAPEAGPDEDEEASEGLPARPGNVAVVGRPNVGKSSLINALLQDQRTIVSPVPGTTRDAVDARFSFQGRDYILVDTAGMRQRGRIGDPLEAAMSGRSAHSINRADVCVHVVDATTGITMQDKKIAGLIAKAPRPCVVAVNKWDLAREQGLGGRSSEKEFKEAVLGELFFVRYAPVVFLSAKTGERVGTLMKAVRMVEQNAAIRIPTGPLNRLLGRAMERRPAPQVHGRRFKILYAAQQVPDSPGAHLVPALVVFCNDPRLLTEAYQRYLEEQLRAEFDLRGCPVKWLLRSRQRG